MRYLLILLIIIPTSVFSQGWIKDFGPGFGYSVLQTIDDGFILTGSLHTGSNYNLTLIKTDHNGDSLWTRFYGDTLESSGLYVIQTNDGGYFAGGNISDFSAGSMFLVKTDHNGDSLWTKKYPGLVGRSFQQTNDGGYVITGHRLSPGSQGWDFIIVKTDSNGDTIWTRAYHENNVDYGYSIKQTNDGGYIMTGTTRPTNSHYDIYVLKTDSSGNPEWSKTIGGYTQEQGYSIIQNLDGSYFLLGYTNLYQGTASGYEQIYLIKMDNFGDTLWAKVFNLHTHNYGYSIQQTSNGEYIITGSINTPNDGQKIFLTKVNSYGDTLWTKTYGYGGSCAGKAVQETNDGGYIITGTQNSPTGVYTMVLIRTDGNGNTLFINEAPMQNKYKKLIKIIDISGREINKPDKNTPYIEIYDDGTTIKKIIVY